MTYILIIFMSIGAVPEKEGMALTNVPGFKSLPECQAAGAAATKVFGGGTKRAWFLCVGQEK